MKDYELKRSPRIFLIYVNLVGTATKCVNFATLSKDLRCSSHLCARVMILFVV